MLNKVVRFQHRVCTQSGVVIEEDSGFVTRVYSNGQFIVADNDKGLNPRRHELLSVVAFQ